MDPKEFLQRYGSSPSDQAIQGMGYKLVLDPLPHQRFKDAMYLIADLHMRQRNHGAYGGVLLTGPSGAGKSTVVQCYAGAFPWQHLPDKTQIPVLLVSVPSSPTVRSLAGALLESLGRKKTSRATAPEKTALLIELFSKCGVELIILDEFQHLFYPPTVAAFRDLSDWLKNLLEATHIAIVACGLPEAELVISSNEQLARRFSERIRMTPFALENPDDFAEFRGVLKAIASALPLSLEVPLHEVNLARRFYIGSYGLIDYVIKILEGSVAAAYEAGCESLDLPAFAAGFRRRVWRDVPDRLNPFHPQSVLRVLDRVGEVFYRHTRQDPVGSPMARAMGLSVKKGGSHVQG